MKELFVALGEHLQAKRKQAGLSQGDVASKLGYGSPQFVSNFERGLCAPPLPKLKALVQLYDMDGEQVLRLMMREHERHIRGALGIRSKKSKR